MMRKNNIIKEIIPNNLNKLNCKNVSNIIIRKLKIYNILNDTNYKLSDLGFSTIEKNNFKYILYYCKMIDEKFVESNLIEYKRKYLLIYNYIKKEIIKDKYYVLKNERYISLYNNEMNCLILQIGLNYGYDYNYSSRNDIYEYLMNEYKLDSTEMNSIFKTVLFDYFNISLVF